MRKDGTYVMMEFITRYWLEVVFSGITTGLCFSFRWMFCQFKAIKLGMQATLRNDIINQYNKYIELEYMPIYAKENVEAMYIEYHALGGNGTITRLYKELLDLPTKKG